MPTIVFQSAPKTIVEIGDCCFIQVDRISQPGGDIITLYRTANGKPDGRQSFQTVMPLTVLREIMQLIDTPTDQSIFEAPKPAAVVEDVTAPEINDEPIKPDMNAMDAAAIARMTKAEMLHLAHQVKTPEDDVDIDAMKKPELSAWLLQKVGK